MIEKLRLKNFRSHQDTTLEFHYGVNVIRGLSLSGKSNIIRALLLLATNRPLGFKYHSNFTSDPNTEVEVKVENGPSILFKKNNDGASYVVEGCPDPFRGFGAAVPEPVKDALNLTDVNVQVQMDQTFLICSSPSEVARAINQITRMEDIDNWTGYLTAKINDANRHKRDYEKRADDARTELRKYEKLGVVETLVSEMEQVESSIADCALKFRDIALLLGEYKVLTQKIKAQQHAVRKERLVNYALSVQREIATTDGKINLIDDLSELQVKISRLQYLLEKESLLNLASEQMQSFNDTKANGKSLSDLLRTVRDFNRSKKVHEDNLKKVREELDTYLSTELKGTCPVCSNAIEGDIDLGIFL